MLSILAEGDSIVDEMVKLASACKDPSIPIETSSLLRNRGDTVTNFAYQVGTGRVDPYNMTEPQLRLYLDDHEKRCAHTLLRADRAVCLVSFTTPPCAS